MNNSEINEVEEFGLIKRISSKFNNKRKSTIIGIGDDSAVINPHKKLMLLSSILAIIGIGNAFCAPLTRKAFWLDRL